MNKYVTQRGRIFETNRGFTFKIDPKEKEYQIRGPYASVTYPNRKSFDIALEMDVLENYVTEVYTQFWN